MPTSWQRADDNMLRAHLQGALAERAENADAHDWSYTETELEAIRAEMSGRLATRGPVRKDEASALASPIEPPPCVEPQATGPAGSEQTVDGHLRSLRPSRRVPRATRPDHGRTRWITPRA